MREKYKAKEQECEELRGVIRKDICSHYVLGECSQKHHNNCVGRNQCIKDLEQECEELKEILNEGCLHNLTLMTEQRVLLQTLAEIKKICNNNDELKGGFNLVDCDKYKLGKHNLAEKIIVKINEVKDDRT